jgi:hypothetical protein
MKLVDLLMSLDAMTNILVEWDNAEHGGIVCDTAELFVIRRHILQWRGIVRSRKMP